MCFHFCRKNSKFLDGNGASPSSFLWSINSCLPLVLRMYHTLSWAFLVDQMVKNLHAMWETWVPSLGQEDSLAKGKATHSSILAWKIPWTEEPGGLQSMWVTKNHMDMTAWLSTHALLYTKWITNKNLLDSPEDYTQYFVTTWTSLVDQGLRIHLAM